MWLWFEVMVAISYLAGCMIYLMFYLFKKPSLHIVKDVNLTDEENGAGTEDFIAVNEILIMINNTMFATAFTGVILCWHLKDHHKFSLTSGILATL